MSISIVQLLIELKGSRYIELYHQAKYIMNNKNQLTMRNFVSQYSCPNIDYSFTSNKQEEEEVMFSFYTSVNETLKI